MTRDFTPLWGCTSRFTSPNDEQDNFVFWRRSGVQDNRLSWPFCSPPPYFPIFSFSGYTTTSGTCWPGVIQALLCSVACWPQALLVQYCLSSVLPSFEEKNYFQWRTLSRLYHHSEVQCHYYTAAFSGVLAPGCYTRLVLNDILDPNFYSTAAFSDILVPGCYNAVVFWGVMPSQGIHLT